MKNDLEMIIRELPTNLDHVNLYAIGDLHIGSREFNEKLTRKKMEIIKNDECGFWVGCGDFLDFGICTSKTNPMEAVLQPQEQKEFLYELMRPYIDKCVALVPGNHERRSVKTVGFNPLYDVACRWQIEDRYREYLALVKLGFGSNHSGKRTWYGIGVSHGSSRNKHQKYIRSFSGLDAFCSGHSHTPFYQPHGTIHCDLRSGKARKVAYKELVVDAGLDSGGYALAGEYEISPPSELQYLRLNTAEHHAYYDEKKVDFGAIQL